MSGFAAKATWRGLWFGLCLLFWPLCWSAPSLAQDAPAGDPVQLEVRIEPAEPQLGDTVRLVLDVSYAEDIQLRFPNKPFVGDGFRYRQFSRKRTSDDGAALVQETLTVELVPVRMGRQRIPAIEMAWVRGEEGGVLRTPKQIVRVKTRMATEIAPELRPAGEPQPLPVENTPLIWSLLIGGVALLAGGLTLLAVKILGPRLRGEDKGPPPRPAHEVAYERLAELKRADYAEAGEFKLFYLELSGIVREYFGNRYRIQALGDTTTELMEALAVVRPKGLALPEIEKFLDESDLVKFAKFTPTRNDMENVLVQAQLFVDRTREEARERREEEEYLMGPVLPAAPLSKRLFAFLADLVLFGVVSTLVLVARKKTGSDWLLWVDLGLLALYLLGRDAPRRGSLGKRVAGLRLAKHDVGSPHASSAARWLRNVPLLLPVAGLVAEGVWWLFDPEDRRIGDRWFGTRVEDLYADRSGSAAWAGVAACTALIVVLAYVLPVHLIARM